MKRTTIRLYLRWRQTHKAHRPEGIGCCGAATGIASRGMSVRAAGTSVHRAIGASAMVSGAPMTSLLPVVIGKPSGENHSLKKKSASGPGKTIVHINGPRDPIQLAHQIVLESNGQCYERRNAWRSGQEGWVWWPKAKMY